MVVVVSSSRLKLLPLRRILLLLLLLLLWFLPTVKIVASSFLAFPPRVVVVVQQQQQKEVLGQQGGHYYQSSRRQLNNNNSIVIHSRSTSTSTSTSSSSRIIMMASMRSATRRTRGATIKDEGGIKVEEDEGDESTTNVSLLLQEWLHHTDEKFHYFLEEREAIEIRNALLCWYRSNRRKLPWRVGDLPPYSGRSAANFQASSNNNIQQQKEKKNNEKKKKAKAKKQQQTTTMDAFFVTTTTKQSQKQKRATTKDEGGGTTCTTTTSTTTTTSSSSDSSSSEQQEQQEEEAAAASTTTTNIADNGYGIWVSEIMLQQTRVEAVIPYWIKWMESFPTIADLANASHDQVNSHWAGLGFYRRARLLHQAAKQVVNDYDGIMPRTVDDLLKLPGIGKYTACAIASIAYGACVPVVDGNVCRVLSRLRAIAQHVKAPCLKNKYGWIIAEQIVQAGDDNDNGSHNAGEVNQALMELGATYCSPSGTGIEDGDPLKPYYYSTRIGREFQNAIENDGKLLKSLQTMRSGEASSEGESSTKKCCPICASNGVSDVIDTLFNSFEEEGEESSSSSKYGHMAFPLAPPKLSKKEDVYAVGVISRHQATTGNSDKKNDSETMWLLTRRPKKGLLAGQWEFPSALVWTSSSSETKNKNKKTKKSKRKDTSSDQVVPKVPPKTRRKALDALLEEMVVSGEDEEMLSQNVNDTKRINIGHGPIEHVFSHVRHTLWIEYGDLLSSAADDDDDEVEDEMLLQWIDSKGREVRWMRESDMEKVGITSGVKKVLKAVKQHQQQLQSNKSSPSNNKRKRRRK